MAALENVKDMYDVVLKPRILHTLLKEDVPNEKHPFDTPSKLSRVVSVVQTHKLLSESLAESTDQQKLRERWKSAVDDWVNRLLSLVSNTTMPDKRWAGICLLGVTCQECSLNRFLASYAAWFEKLLSFIQSSAESQFVKVASCTSMSDLITRLAEFPNAKKDGTSLSGKLIQPVLKLLKDDNSESVWEGAIHLLCTVITFFPAALHRHYDSAEAAITSNIFSGKCSVNMLKKLAHCLALLPKSKGDEDSWLSMMRKILLLINGYLTELFHGLEEESKWDEAVRLLVPPGESPPPSLWGQKLLEDTSDKTRKIFKLSIVSTLMLTCCAMITNSYPVQVTVPVRSLLAVVERVLMVNGSLPHVTSAFVIAAEQEFICSELPVLHSYSLELLSSVIKGIRSQLLPHAAYTVRLIKEYFGRCELPELRIKVYSITKMLLISMGIGIAMYLAQEVISNSLFDLSRNGKDAASAVNSKMSSEVLLQPCNRKRKHGASGCLGQQHSRMGLEAEAPMNCLTAMISVKIAALETLEALLTVGGAMRSESWRSKVDQVLIAVATDSYKEGWANKEQNYLLPDESASTYADLQLASLRALLASLLSPSRVRPPHLARCLELFRRGRLETGTKLSEFCVYALLALEVLIHPRALPLADFSANSHSSLPETIYSGGQSSPPDSDDDLYGRWLSKETEAPEDTLGKDMGNRELSEIARGEKISVEGSSDMKSLGRSEQEPAAPNADVEMRMHNNDRTVESQHFQESMVQLQEPTSSRFTMVPAPTFDPKDSKMEFARVATETGASDSTDNLTASVETVKEDKGSKFFTAGYSSAQKDTITAFESDNDLSTDSFPGIVDADPDSD